MDGTNTADRRITWAVGYMQRHLADPIAIPALAARVKLSPSRFRQLFRAQVGLGPAQYQQHLRLRRAQLLIERTFLTVKEVMALVGYNDPSHFSRDFRRLHGVAPSALRERGVTASMPPAPGSSLETPTHKRIRERGARDPSRAVPNVEGATTPPPVAMTAIPGGARRLPLHGPDRTAVRRGHLLELVGGRRG